MADLGSKKVRKSNFSPEEVEVLVNTVSKHYNILYGEFAKRAVNKHARHRVWLDVTKHVNRVSIERRTLQEVKNKWKKCQHLYRDPDKLDFPEDFVVPNVWEPLTAIKDSMPLEQRLTKTPGEQEPVLQSQPLSPTKLKVTRQAAKPPQPSPKPPTPEPPNEEVCLRWNSHHSNMQSTFPNLLLREQYVDATLVAEGQTLKCHRLILSSCSPYFEEVLSGISPFQHPVLFMKDIPFWILKSLCDFMYAGEVHIYQNKLEELLAVAEMLKIKGLAGKTEGAGEEAKPSEPIKEEKKDEKEVKDRKKPQPAQQTDCTTTPRPGSKMLRSSQTSKKIVEKVHKELVKSDDILDPLDLLEPVYEELTKESKPPSALPKFRECKNISLKKTLPKKIKKRKLSEEREESPPPMFLSRKGTRSRPNVKIPKYYHTHYERVQKNLEFPESTIVREPHTDQADPLMEVEEIKAEPLDFQDDVIEIEDNVVSFSDQEMPSLHEEEIIGNYDSPIVNINDTSDDDGKEEDQTVFKKINLLPQPIIMDVHSVSEKSLNTLKIVDVEQIKGPAQTLERKSEDPLATDIAIVDVEGIKEADDPLNTSDVDMAITNVESIANTSDVNMAITNVESIANTSDVDMAITNVESIANTNDVSIAITNVESIANTSSVDIAITNVESIANTGDVGIAITNVESIANASDVGIAITNVESIVNTSSVDIAITNVESIANTSSVDIAITNVESIADVELRDAEDKGEDNRTQGFHIAEVVSENEQVKNWEGDAGFHIAEVVSEHEEVKKGEEGSDFHIEKVESEHEEVKKEDGDANFHIEKVVGEYEEASEGDAGPSLRIANVVTENEEAKEAPNPNIHVEGAATKQEEVKGDADPSLGIEKATDEIECVDNEESTALGFHIAKVASEQFAMNEAPLEEDKPNNGKDVISEDCANELGFQITNVVSGHFDELGDNPHKDLNNSELETIVNDSEESHGKKEGVRGLTANVNNTFSEETETIAESLEELLEK